MYKSIFGLVASLIVSTSANAATKYTIAGSVPSNAVADSALLIQKSTIVRASITKGKFTFKNVSPSALKQARLYFFKAGAPVGPGVLKASGSYKYVAFSGTGPKGAKKLDLRFKLKSNVLSLTSKLNSKWISTARVSNSNFAGESLGFSSANATGMNARRFVGASARAASVNADTDADGVPDILDVDDDADGITDERDSGGGSMISTLYLNFTDTLNAHRGNLNDTTIASLFASENIFNLTFFLSTQNDFPTATGGHVICGASQSLCRSQADGGSTSFYTGVSESNAAVLNQRWSDYNADGSGKPNLEPINFGGSGTVLVAAVQPRSSLFSAGELLSVNVTRGTTVLGSSVFSVLPPNISSPMLYSYNVGGGTSVVNYDNGSEPGSSSGSPIVLTGNSITLDFYPPQRRAIPVAEADGLYRDLGNSRIGVVVGGAGITSEFTCAGYYSNLSTGLTEAPASESMPSGSVSTQTGAILWPITDSASDAPYTTGSLKSMTVDLAQCLSRASVASGTYLLTLIYAGSDTNFGAPRSGQNIFVTIPSAS